MSSTAPSARPRRRRSVGRCAGLVVLGLGLATGCASVEGARLYARGTEALERGDTGRAVADLEQAAQLLPGASEVHNHLGLAYARAGRDERALAAFRRAVELDCENDAAVHNLRAAEAGRLRPPSAATEDGKDEPRHGS
jgi:Flp pilus assembly protein TadD